MCFMFCDVLSPNHMYMPNFKFKFPGNRHRICVKSKGSSFLITTDVCNIHYCVVYGKYNIHPKVI